MSAAPGVNSPIAAVLASCKRAFMTIGVTSGIVNILTLTGSLFMLQVYDRVLSSYSVPTLVVLCLAALIAYTFQGILDYIRMRMLALIGERMDEEVGPQVYAAVVGLPLKAPGGQMENLQPLRDLDAIRGFMGSQGPVALFDLPWVPVYLAICFLFHPVIGLVAIGAAVFLISLTLATEVRGKKPMKDSLEALSIRNYHAENAQRGSEVIQAMGMFPHLKQRWQEVNQRSLKLQRESNFLVGSLSAVAKAFRMVMQSLTLAVAAYLAIHNSISPGTIIAATILTTKVLTPVDLAIGSWKAYVAARQGYERLQKMFAMFPLADKKFQLPPPRQSLVVNDLAAAAPGGQVPIISRVSFKAQAGQGIGVIGPSASGKSTLARAILNIWPIRGEVLLDGASITQWSPENLGPSIGYLPQDVQLFEGTIAQNIARFAPGATPETVIEAAKAASFHDYALSFPKGYDTPVGRGGSQLSAGQRQRLGLARALYGNPFLVVLDEPNANLDAEGEAAVTQAIRTVRERGGIAIVIAHRPSVLAAVDQLLVMRNGTMAAFGPRDEVLAKTVTPHPRAAQTPATKTAASNVTVLPAVASEGAA